MAWISLVVVVAIFFFPGIGIASHRIGQELIANIQLWGVSVAFPIPGTGPFRLLLECVGAWLVLWLLLSLPDWWLGQKALAEKRPYQDFLVRIKQWNDFIKAFRPTFSDRLAVWLAKLFVAGFVVKLLFSYVLQLFLDVALPSLLRLMTSQFSAEFAPLIQSFLGDTAKSLSGFGMNVTGIILLVLSALILIANRFMKKEKQYRYQYAVQQRQNQTRLEQKEIEIPAAQH